MSEALRETTPTGTERTIEKFDRALAALAAASRFAKAEYQNDVFQMAEVLMGSDAGMKALLERAHDFDRLDVFTGGPWQHVQKLRPPFVAGCLLGQGVYPVVEILSDLRVLALATGRGHSDHMSRSEAVDFLNEVMALNLSYVFPRDTEEERVSGGPHREASIRLFALIAQELGLGSLRDEVVWEIEAICHQRPLMTTRVRQLIDLARRIPASGDHSSSEDKTLQLFTEAISAPSPLSREVPALVEYRKRLQQASLEELQHEAKAFAASMQRTGLVADQHAILLRKAAITDPALLCTALGLGRLGEAELHNNLDLAKALIRVAVLPSTAQCIYGFGRLLERGLLSRSEVSVGLQRLVELDLHAEVRSKLLASRTHNDGASANAVLLAGALAVLGQPLGVGQGSNPTCQAARGISLWSQHAPAYFLELLISAARDGHVEMPFEGLSLRTSELLSSPRQLGTDLDAASLILVPHLDQLYEEMMRQVSLRHEDGHKWVNPALYGRWVASGFTSVFADVAQTQVDRFEDFARRFFATHHPAYNEHALMYPNPVGLCITNSHGEYLGPHAVSLQRVDTDPDGGLRAYFFNPNNEGRQDWGFGVCPSVQGKGELEGESSLPFSQFASRLYAFHYNPYEEGDAFAVPEEEVRTIEKAARESWGTAFQWL